ncbi:hypothetical protein B0A48_03967 [Cryoendolithus antarcticus]|uniref:Uncharacterized protein n=1 Tax=Cryoendolithus antarcticus TaxID=1507870 RepID=A0A1V8TH03_9PEZI|nr:hypothetical protein B0A48_03967 [Cryoendolithus antarcticus]
MSAPPASEQRWSSQQSEAALADLERLQDQISKAQTFAELKKAAVNATTDLQTLRQTWNAERTQEVLTKAKESESNDGDLSREAEVAQYGWIDKAASNEHSASVTA